MAAAYHVTATGQVYTGFGKVKSITLKGGSAASTATVYDNTSAANPIIADLSAPINVTFNTGPIEVPVAKGVHLVLAGTGASATVYME